MWISLVRLIAVASLAAPTVAQAAVGWIPSSPNYAFADGSAGFASTTTGGIETPGVLVGFNPQPAPPGDFLSYQLSFAPPITPEDPDFVLSITESDIPLAFSVVPEPATWALMGLGFASIGSLAAFARRQKAGRKDADP